MFRKRSECGVRGAGCRVRGAGCGVGVEGAGCGLRGAGSTKTEKKKQKTRIIK